MAVDEIKSVGETRLLFEDPEEVPLNLEKVVIKTMPKEGALLMISLGEGETSGFLRIRVSLEGFGGVGGYFNKQPYPDKETAFREYRHVLEQVRQGNYSLEIYNDKLKLLLTDSK